MRQLSTRQWAVAGLATVVTAVLTGIPTEMIGNPWFVRMTPVLWWNRPAWLLTSLLVGLLLATYVAPRGGDGRAAAIDRHGRRGGVGGVVGYLAIGCPVCNKLVVLALGTSGAMSWFAPLQPLLAAASIALLVIALRTRMQNAEAAACPTGVAAALRGGSAS